MNLTVPRSLVISMWAASMQAAELPYQIAYSTYLGGTSWEHAREICKDPAGFTYITGGTGSSNFTGASSFPGTNTYNGGQPNSAADGAFGGCDVFVTKMDPTGKVVWTKFIGGPNYDRAYSMAFDPSGNIVIAGRAGRGFPVINALQPTFSGGSGTTGSGNYGNQNGFIAKLTTSGDILWATYFGTGDLVRNLAIDSAGDIYVPLVLSSVSSRTAFTTSALSAFHGKLLNSPPTTNTEDAGLAKVKGDGTGVVWARWLGGTGNEATNPCIKVDASGQPHLLISTSSNSSSLPAVGTGVQTTNAGGSDSYLAKFSADGTTQLFGTYIGGSGHDAHETHSLALDTAGNAFIAIHTNSANFPLTPGTIDTTVSADDVGIVKVNSSGVRVLSTLFGGAGNENPDGISVDSAGRVFIAMESTSNNLVTTASAWKRTASGSNDGAFFIVSPDFTTVEYSSYFGGTLYDNARAMYRHSDGSIYLTGGTLSTNFPVVYPDDNCFNGGSHRFAPGSGDCFVICLRIDPVQAAAQGNASFNSQTGLYEQSILVSNNGTDPTGGFQIRLSNVPVGVTPANGILDSGTGTWIVSMPLILAPGQSQSIAIQFSGASSPFSSYAAIVGAPLTISSIPAAFTTSSSVPAFDANGAAFLDFTVASGRQYQVEFGSNLATWSPATAVFTARTGLIQWKDDGSTTGTLPKLAAKRFYRLRDVVLP